MEKICRESPTPITTAQQSAGAVSSFAARSPSPSSRRLRSSATEISRQSGSTDPAVSLYSVRGSTRLKQSSRPETSRHRHSRNRDDVGRGSGGTEGESSASSVRSFHKAQKRKAPSQKAMLSKALQKANHAVLLDNAQNCQGAMDAYGDACALLKQVMARSSTDDDRRKLEAVRNTYSNRIIELRNTDLSYQSADGKALPEPPREKESKDQDAQSPFSDGGNEYATIETAAIAPQSWIPSDVPDYRGISSKPKSIIPGPRQPLLPPVFKVEDKILQASETAQKKQQMQYQKLADLNAPNRVFGTTTSLEPPLLKRYLPPPLSPRRPLSPAHLAEESPTKPAKIAAPSVRSDEPCEPYHTRQETAESTSWLDIIDESGGSSSSSVHSRTSLTGLRRKRIRAASGVTEAEFDAALDAAVEAAYDDGFEPDDDDDEIRPMRKPKFQSDERVFVSDVRRNVEIAKEMVREAEREAAILLAKDREKRRLQQKLAQRNSIDTDYGDEDEDEEERMLEEMTRDYIMDDSEYELQSKSALPRQSDSSGFSGRTWGSSIGSNPTTAGTSLSTVAEASVLPSLATQLQSKAMPPPAHPPPMGALPPPPSTSAIATPTQISNGLGPGQQGPLSKTNQGVRERRLSGINTKRLKIETNSKAPSSVNPSLSGNGPLPLAPLLIPTQAVTEQSKPPSASTESQQAPPNLKFSPPSATSSQTIPRKELPQSSRPASIDAAAGVVSTSLVLPKTTSADGEYNAQSRPSSPGRFATKAVGLRKNFSSSSLRNKGMVGSSSDIFEISPSTPSTATPRKAPTTAVPILPTPIGTGFIVDRLPPGGIYLFESDIHSPITPGSPNPLASNAPLPLEPCPELPLLRPFWFLRCIYQTIAHPRGAYISTKLFVPRDIWRVKSIKLKSVEEKISHCDLLSAALLKLAKVDTLDADAVLKEMQFLEHVMDQAQANLSKKLGNDVGVVGASALFKGSGTMDDGASNSEAMTLKSTNTNNKSYLSSWRKLRSKNSVGPGVIPTATGHKEGSKDGLMLESLPMTNASEPKFSKRDLSRVQYTGPNSNYMAALARLCDAVQVLDQIARQVEDPGLKHSSQTHVGLELSMRHAAEFFGFFVCRFVLTDVSLMLDKFIKRGTEWVLG